ncbi:cytochrome P450 monooxygenase pc-3 [Hysterangium stoloniferum]|nr:cytochrome P450 monooxygenase pc-3 [Hysterangium stoloniferum]
MSYSRFPPGVLLLAQYAPKQLLPIALVFFAHQSLPYHVSGYMWAVAYAFAIPFVLVVKGIISDIQEKIEMKKLGARRVPRIKSYVPGGFDLLFQLIKAYYNGYMGEIFREMTFNGSQTVNLRILGNDAIFTIEPENIKAVLATNFDNFEKGKEFHRFVKSVLGTGVFNSDGEMWKFHRAMTRPFFARDRVTDFELFNNHAEIAVAKLSARFAEDEAIDFQVRRLDRFTLDSATEFLFGSCVHSLSGTLPYAWNSPRRQMTTETHSNDKFPIAFSQAQEQIAFRLRLADIWPWTEFWKDKTKDPMQVIYEYIDPILREGLDKRAARENRSPIEKNEAGPATLLDHLLEQTDDFNIIRDEMLNIMIAGRDTTMCTLSFTVYCLSQHPAILARLREEILVKVGPTGRPTIEDVRDCKYLRAVINETLRLYPPVPFNMRIPYSIFLMHRRTDLWGPDADKFDPERFLDDRVHKYLTPNPFIFLPFNAGPRICLGQQFAYNETSFMLIRLLQAFDVITLAGDAQPPESRPPKSWKFKPGTQGTDEVWAKSHLTLYAYKGLWLKMRSAQQTNSV